MLKSNYIVFDCETGGLSPDKNPITQFACVILDGKNLKEIDRYETFVKPYADLKIEQKALDKTMVRMSDINSGISDKEFVKVITTLWDSHRINGNRERGRLVPVGHNIPFDINMLNWVLDYNKKSSVYDWFQPNFIDTYSLAKLAFAVTGEEKLNLSACCDRTKINITDAHGAMNDVEATADLLRFFMKKLRSKKGVDTQGTDHQERPKGKKFFEFSCE